MKRFVSEGKRISKIVTNDNNVNDVRRHKRRE